MADYQEILNACPDAKVCGGKVYTVVEGKNMLIAWPDGKGGLTKSEALNTLILELTPAKPAKTAKPKKTRTVKK